MFKTKRSPFTLRKLLKGVDLSTYLGSNISSTENDVNIHFTKVWNAIDRLLIVWKSDLFNKIKQDFFQANAVSTGTLTKSIKKKQDGNYTKVLCAVLNKSWKQQSTKLYLYSHRPPISQTIQVRQTRYKTNSS